MKLYRGINAEEFSHFTPKVAKRFRATWAQILANRAVGDFAYPASLNAEILAGARLGRLQRQHFTDRRPTALRYARSMGGLLVEIDVPAVLSGLVRQVEGNNLR